METIIKIPPAVDLTQKIDFLIAKPANQWIEEAKQRPIPKQTHFGKWEVKPSGEMIFDNYYVIEAYRLTEEDWILHLSSKLWINWNDFIPAYLQALENARIPKVTILAYYKPAK